MHRCARKRLFGACWRLLALCASTRGTAAQVQLDLDGVGHELDPEVRAALTLEQYVGRDITPAQAQLLYRDAAPEIRRSLEPYGYYDVGIRSELSEDAGTYHATFHVALGDPVLVRELRVHVQGDGAGARAVGAALADFRPRVGERLDQPLYERSKAAVESALAGAGFLRVQALSHRIELTRSTRSARIELSWDSGPRYRLGAVKFSGAQFPDAFLERFIPWHPGDAYSAETLSKLQQRLIDAQFFSSVIVKPRLDQAHDLTVPVDVVTTPAKRMAYTGKLYYNTDTGPGTSLTVERRWLNSSGHSIQAEFRFEQRSQEISSTYRIPIPGQDARALNFGGSYSEDTTDTSDSISRRLGVNLTRRWLDFTQVFGLQFISGDFTVGGENGNSILLYAEAGMSRKTSDDPQFTRHGFSIGVDLQAGPKSPLTDTSFARITVDGKYIDSLGARARLILRASLGAMAVSDFDKLPPELRYFAGGDRSIRGFEYQQIGSTNAAGEVIGGTFLSVVSGEFEYFPWNKWGLAAFVDAGDAFRTGEFALNVGVGFGLRWKSPVGLVRLDLGWPVKGPRPDTMHVGAAIGPDL